MTTQPQTTPTENKPNYRHFDNERDKPFYAAYLNTAKQNVFLIFKDISDRLELGFSTKEDRELFAAELWLVLSNNQKPEKVQKIIDSLKNQFGFLEQMALNHARNKSHDHNATEIRPEDYAEVLKKWVEQLFAYRNSYTHAVHDPVTIPAEIIVGMRHLFDAEWQKFKERLHFTENDTAHLLRLGKEKNRERKGFKYGFLDKHAALTEKGFLYFVCLWLEKKDAQEFLKKHEGFKRSEFIYEKATLERYTWFRTKIPKPRLVSDQSKQGLFMDMVNELKRCPKPLFGTLSEADKVKFRPTSDTLFDGEGKISEVDYVLTPELKRNQNRCYYFALRYLDQSFKHLKFHVDLGNYCFHSYDQVIEEIPRKRRWIKRMKAFGTLSDFDESNRPAAWGEKLPDSNQLEKPDIYITETTPHYHFDGEGEVKNIGMKWKNGYQAADVWPDVSGVHGKDARPKTEAPDYWLSLYELPALAFYQTMHLRDNTRVKKSVETVIHEFATSINSFLSEVANGAIAPGYDKAGLDLELNNRKLERSYIPKAVIKYLLETEARSYEEKAKTRLAELIAENKKRQSKVDRQKSHYRMSTASKDYVPMRSGDMADFLAHDMIRLQKAVDQDQGKANGTEFQVLQAKLAYFGKNKRTLHQTFKLCNLISAVNAHPFLEKIDLNKCYGILDFYIEYLHQRECYFKLCQIEGNYSEYHFLKLGEVDKSIQLLIQRQQAAVMNLPRGLFKKPILNALKSSDDSRACALQLLKEPRVNVAYIIKTYFEQVRQDGQQAFYADKRNYPLIDKLYDKRGPKDRSKVEKNWLGEADLVARANEIKDKLIEKIAHHIQKNKINTQEDKLRVKHTYDKAYSNFTNNEKQIRLYQNCDRVLFLMADHMYSRGDFLLDSTVNKEKDTKRSKMILDESYKLNAIGPDAEQGLLSMKMDVRLPVFYPEKEKTHRKIIIRKQLKVKNYGDFRGFLKDRRLYGLLPFITENTIPLKALQLEFSEYHKVRLVVFEAILDCEHRVIKKHNLHHGEDTNHVNHDIVLAAITHITDNQKIMMKALRNAFCHSIYPAVSEITEEIDGSGFCELELFSKEQPEIKEKSIIVQLGKIATRLYQEAMEETI